MEVEIQSLQAWINKYNFYIIVALLIAVYHLGFAKPLPILKRGIVYFVMFLGAYPLTVLHIFGLPMIAVLLVSVLLLLVVRLRQKWYNPSSNEKEVPK